MQRLDFAFPTEVNALRQDQYLLLDTMLVAPVNPFVNGTKPWTSGQTGKDPKIPGSFNRTVSERASERRQHQLRLSPTARTETRWELYRLAGRF